MNATTATPLSLTALANHYGSDKGTIGPTARWSAQNYTDVYEGYLSRLRYQAITMLEIGLGVDGPKWTSLIQQGRNSSGGASLKMWRDYFPKATIYGIDVNVASHLDDGRVRTFVADQGSPPQLQRFVDECKPGSFDVIVDDGSHNPLHQQVSLAFFYPLLKPGGLYFIEDLAANGLGDISRGGVGSDSVLNTRKVLKALVATGEVGEPSGLGRMESEYIARYVDSVYFHSPMPRIRYRLRPRRSRTRRPVVPILSYVADSERLCAIRKTV